MIRLAVIDVGDRCHDYFAALPHLHDTSITAVVEPDATAAQHKALDTFFNERQYYISLEKGLFKPALLVWKTESQHSNERLLRSVIEIQDKLNRRQYKLQAVLEYVYKHNQPLFFTIQTILQARLKRPE